MSDDLIWRLKNARNHPMPSVLLIREAANALEAAQQRIADLERTSQYWKDEHLAGNRRIAELEARLLGAAQILNEVGGLQNIRRDGWNDGYLTGLREALEAVAAEEELQGQMPDEMWGAICGDRDATEEAMRIAVRKTKSGIAIRIHILIDAATAQQPEQPPAQPHEPEQP